MYNSPGGVDSDGSPLQLGSIEGPDDCWLLKQEEVIEARSTSKPVLGRSCRRRQFSAPPNGAPQADVSAARPFTPLDTNREGTPLVATTTGINGTAPPGTGINVGRGIGGATPLPLEPKVTPPIARGLRFSSVSTERREPSLDSSPTFTLVENGRPTAHDIADEHTVDDEPPRTSSIQHSDEKEELPKKATKEKKSEVHVHEPSPQPHGKKKNTPDHQHRISPVPIPTTAAVATNSPQKTVVRENSQTGKIDSIGCQTEDLSWGEKITSNSTVGVDAAVQTEPLRTVCSEPFETKVADPKAASGGGCCVVM